MSRYPQYTYRTAPKGTSRSTWIFLREHLDSAKDALQSEREEVERHNEKRLDLRNRIKEGNLSQKELHALESELERDMPDRMKRHSPEAANDEPAQEDIISISERPAAVEDRAVPGHWEGDLLSGSKNSYIVTLVERHTRYVMLAKVADKSTQTVVSALIKQAKKLPNELYKSLTWDRGRELTDHRRFSLATDIDVYFCDPRSPWQRGSNENTNGLLRQYFPKGTDLSVYSQVHLDKVARQLNERPRKTLGFETPAERFNACVASIG